MAEEKQEAAAAPTETGGGGGGGKIVPILTVVNLLATLGIVGMLAVSFQKQKHSESLDDLAVHDESHVAAEGGKPAEGAAAKAAPTYGKMIALDQFTVNLSTPGSSTPRFARVNISLEVGNADIETEVTQKMPQVRNAVIDLFNSKTPSELATADGREYLKEELRNAINGFLIQGKIKGVYFTNFSLGG
jgi:flagellar FliL protein